MTIVETPETVDHVARDVREFELGSYQRTVRRLLVNPLVTSGDADLLVAIRTWERQLREDLALMGGYRLDVSASTARLVRRPLALDPHHPARTVGQARRPFDGRRYAYLCLVLAGLMTSGSQVLLTDLARRLSDDASRIDGLGFERDEHAHRSALVDVVQWLESVGALRVRDGSTSADLDVDALYDLDHEILHALTPSIGLRDVASIDDRFHDLYGEGRDERRRRTRHRVTRMVLERPCVLLSDLDDEERAWLQRNGARLAGDVERLTGLTLERRREGVALIDTEGDASDRAFPARGSPAQLGLLLGDALTTAEQAPALAVLPSGPVTHHRLATVIDGARSASAPIRGGDSAPSGELVGAWPLDEVERIVAALIATHPGVRRDLRDDPGEAARVAIAELVGMDLARPSTTDEAVIVLVPTPPLARYRPVPAERRAGDDAQLEMFGDPG